MIYKLNIDCRSRKATDELLSPIAELIIFLCLYDSSWDSLGIPHERLALSAVKYFIPRLRFA